MRLTADEIKLVVFLVVALLVGVTVKHYRHRDRLQLPPPAEQSISASKAEVDYE